MYRMLLLHYTLLLVKQHVFREKYRRPIILRYKIVRNYFQEIFFLFFSFSFMKSERVKPKQSQTSNKAK